MADERSYFVRFPSLVKMPVRCYGIKQIKHTKALSHITSTVSPFQVSRACATTNLLEGISHSSTELCRKIDQNNPAPVSLVLSQIQYIYPASPSFPFVPPVCLTPQPLALAPQKTS
jgi:hypothetical protein